jgi:hypothetical protein
MEVGLMYAMKPVYYPSVEVNPCIVNDIFKELMKIEKQKNIEEENELNMELNEDIGQEM